MIPTISCRQLCEIKRDRINWCNSHQKELRSESYQGLIDYVHSKQANLQNYHVGKIVILPSTFIGSPRNMIQKYQDSMAITKVFGKPDLFITLTCNSNCQEIKKIFYQVNRQAIVQIFAIVYWILRKMLCLI